MFPRFKFHVWLIAIIVVFAALAAAFRDEPVAYAQGNDRDYVDVGLTLEAPFNLEAAFSQELDIIVVNNGSRTAYDVEVVVDVAYPDGSYFIYFPNEHVGTVSVPGGSLRWTIPELGSVDEWVPEVGPTTIPHVN